MQCMDRSVTRSVAFQTQLPLNESGGPFGSPEALRAL